MTESCDILSFAMICVLIVLVVPEFFNKKIKTLPRDVAPNNMKPQYITVSIGLDGDCKVKRHKRHHKARKWKVRQIAFLITHIKTKGDIVMQQAKVDQVFFATWPEPKDKYGNPTKVQPDSIQFVSDFPDIADIVKATDEELTAYNDGAADEAKIAPESFLYTGKVTTRKSVGSTMVRIKADPTAADDDSLIEGTLTVEVLAGDAAGFAEGKTTTPVDNLATPE